jgi:tetratricopeptide (TPR) repeat protein
MDTAVTGQPKSESPVQYLPWIGAPIARLRELLFSLRVVSIPSLSVAAGFLLYWNVPQTQDLFLEIIGSGWGSVWYWPDWPVISYWVLFYVIAFLAWALPVYLSSRWIIARYNEWARTTLSDCLFPLADWVARALPPALAALCFAAITVGQWQATRNAPDSFLCRLEPEQTDSAKGVKEQDPGLLKDIKDPVPAPASLTELSGRSPSGADQVKHKFFLSEFDCQRYLQEQNKNALQAHWVEVPPSKARPTIEFAQNSLRKGALLLLAVLFLTFGVAFRHWRSFVRWPFLILQLACAAAAGWLIYHAIALERDLQDPFSVDAIAILPIASLAAAWLTWKIFRRHSEKPLEIPTGFMPFFHWLILVAAIIALGALLLLDPGVIAEQVMTFRASLLAAGLGIWVMPLTVLAAGSIRFRFPLVISCLVILGIANWFVGDHYDIRTVHGTEAPTRPSIDDSIKRWMEANNCGPTEADPKCPAPIIVLAAGGASRSAFFAASVLGELMDRSNDAAAKDPARKSDDFKNQLFAISGVSGGSVAAMMFEAALADSTKNPVARLDPPCHLTNTAKDDKLWFGKFSEESSAPSIKESWKNCMQILTAGDFLSPAFVRLIGADVLNLRFWYGDRAQALEQSWERRYKLITENSTLADNFTQVRQRVLDRGDWLPVLLLNSTSVSTGRRIIISNVDYLFRGDPKDKFRRDPNDKKPCYGLVASEGGGRRADCGRVFQDSYDLYELFQSRLSDAKHSDGCETCDVRLSTAAAMSARFPVFSPHGTIRNAERKVADRVVDGGYFENYGAITAQELAEKLNRSNLSPLILLITNEPRTPVMACVDTNSESHQPLEYPQTREATTAALVSSPAEALLGTQNSRGSLDAISLCNRMKYDRDGKLLPGYGGNFLHIGVSGNIKLSMSWWLSKTVQRALDEELRDETGNKSTLSAITQALRVDPKAVALAQGGDNELRKGNYDDAIEYYKKAIEQSPSNADYYDKLGRAYNAKRDLDSALSSYNKAIELNPKNALYYMHRGLIHREMRNYDLAVDAYSKAIELDPKSVFYNLERGRAYEANGQRDRAFNDYDTAIELQSTQIKLHSTNAAYYVDRASLFERKSDYDRAIVDYTSAIGLNPSNAAYYNDRAWSYFKGGKAAQGLPDVEKSLELRPNDAPALDTRAHIYEAMGKREEAIADYRQALKLAPNQQESKAGLDRLGASPE